MAFHVYILYSQKCDKYYVGHTESLESRNEEHNIGKGGQVFKFMYALDMVYQEEFITRSDAMKREKEIKNKKSRKYIEWLIAKG